MIKVFFICHVNICRSTLLESVFTYKVKELGLSDRFVIDSAATSTEEIGNPPHRGTVNKLRETGIPLVPHRAKQISLSDYDKFDYIIGMDTANIRNLNRILKGDPEGKVYKFLSFAGSGRDIADPWYTGDFDTTYNDVIEGCEGFLEYLKQDMPADTLQAIRQLPSLSEVFAHMLKEMKKEASSTLIIDLRNNSGGWTPIVLPTLYQLFGDHFLQTDMDIEFYRIISPLYMQKLQTNLQDFNQAYGTDYAYGDYTFSTDEADTTNIEQRRTDFIENCMSSVPEELRKQQGKALYTPEHIYVITNERTFSAAFHYTFYLWKMGATLVGIPSGQAPNTYMEQTLFRLPYTGMQGSISNSIQICFPGKDRCAHTLYPDLIPTYQDYQRYNFDVQTEILYLLDKIKSAPHSHTNPAEKNQK